MRRAALVLLALTSLLAGCAIFPEETASSTSLFSPCPQWIPSLGAFRYHGAIPGNDSSAFILEPPFGHAYNGFPLDLVVLRVGNLTLGGGALEVRAYNDHNNSMGTQLGIRSHRGDDPRQVPVLPFAIAADAAREFEVYLSPVQHGAAPNAVPPWLELRNLGTGPAILDLDARFYYRVCGV